MRALPRLQRFRRDVAIGARLDLDRRHDLAVSRDEVDLARWHAVALRQNAVAPKPQMPEAEQLGGEAAAMAGAAATGAMRLRHQRPAPVKASARA
jgi:hypothetical protein